MLIKIARSQLGQYLVGFTFEYLAFLLPVRRVFENKHLIAFHHLRPAYPVHILIVPKCKIKDLGEIQQEDSFMLKNILKSTENLVKQLGLNNLETRLVINAGAYQDVPQLHFHLITDSIENKNKKS